MTENRQHPRYAVELDCEITVDGRHLSGRTYDVSRGGFCMLASEPLAVSAVCEVHLALVFSDNQFSEQLRLAATIVWCTRTQGSYQIGFKFAPVDEQNRAYLTLFMQFLEGNREPDETTPEGETS